VKSRKTSFFVNDPKKGWHRLLTNYHKKELYKVHRENRTHILLISNISKIDFEGPVKATRFPKLKFINPPVKKFRTSKEIFKAKVLRFAKQAGQPACCKTADAPRRLE